jgi:hypothetical protein
MCVVRADARRPVARHGQQRSAQYGYVYESLAPEKANRLMEPFLVTMTPTEFGEFSSHDGQEFLWWLVTTLSGLLNKPGIAVYATSPGPAPPLVADLADRAEQATPRVEVITGYQGPARVVTYTVNYDGMEPARCTVIADTPAGARVVATCHDAALADRVTREELIGTTVDVDGTRFTVS